ncbi:hypothetical protein QJQ45_002594 [Haematococcus lacustris]|nr:hypothetical protein QJQ45_002594 [Haematococcus lacustris]
MLALGLSATASEFEDKNVINLTASNYESKVGKGKMRGHCKRLADTWKQLGAAFKTDKRIQIGHVDCTVARDVCKAADVSHVLAPTGLALAPSSTGILAFPTKAINVIKGYPTLKVIYKGEEYQTYKGPRELSALKAFVQEAATDLLWKDMEEVSMVRHGRAKQLVVATPPIEPPTPLTIRDNGFSGLIFAPIHTRIEASESGCAEAHAEPVGHVAGPRGSDQLRGRVVLVDERRTTRVSSAVNGSSHVRRSGTMSSPPGVQARSPQQGRQPTKGKGKGQGKAAKSKPAPQPGRWLDRDCNVALNMQRIGESWWRPLELCYWPGQGALPAKGKDYPGLGYKRLRDKPPKAQQQEQQAVAAQ